MEQRLPVGGDGRTQRSLLPVHPGRCGGGVTITLESGDGAQEPVLHLRAGGVQDGNGTGHERRHRPRIYPCGDSAESGRGNLHRGSADVQRGPRGAVHAEGERGGRRHARARRLRYCGGSHRRQRGARDVEQRLPVGGDGRTQRALLPVHPGRCGGGDHHPGVRGRRPRAGVAPAGRGVQDGNGTGHERRHRPRIYPCGDSAESGGGNLHRGSADVQRGLRGAVHADGERGRAAVRPRPAAATSRT